MVTYDPSIIQQHTSRLYDRARALIFLYGAGFGLFGLFGGAVTNLGLRESNPGFALFGALLMAGIGAAVGRARGFELRLQAQVALCQAQIELNTRLRSAPAHPPVHAPSHHPQAQPPPQGWQR